MSTIRALRLPRSGLAVPGLTRHRLVVIVLLGLAFAFYWWTGSTSYPIGFSRVDTPNSVDTYNLLTTAFLHGHLYLPLHVPHGLIALKDPYSPTDNLPYQANFHDLLLYHDHFYPAWGPSPTLLFALIRITGYRPSDPFAVVFYCFGGLVAATGLLHLLARRFVPGMPNWALSLGTAGLALMNVAPFLLRRPAEYEIAISGAYFFEMTGLYLVASALLAPSVRRRRMAVGSLLLGLALLARPTMAADLFLLLGIAIVLIRRGEARLRTVLAVLGPFAVCVILLAVYNDVRFGGFGDFGTQYQLAGLDVQHLATEQLSYVPPGMFSYLFIPAQISLQFPHVFLQTTAQYPFPLPHGYEGTPGMLGPEIAGGMLPTMPITILLLVLPVLWLRRRPGDRGALLVVSIGVGLTLVVIFLLAYALFGTTQRYEVDFASLGLVSAYLLWGVMLSRRARGSWSRRGVAGLGVVLSVMGMVLGVAVSITGYVNLLLLTHPAEYDWLRSLTTPFVTAATELTGRPALVEVSSPAPVTPPPGSPYTQFDAVGSSTEIGGTPVTITIVSPRNEAAAITALAKAGSVPLAGQVIDVSSNGTTRPVPVLGASLRMPITLHRGMNQIVLVSSGATPSEISQTQLDDLHITS